MKRGKPLAVGLIFIMMVLFALEGSALSNIPYHTYNYDYWEDVYYTPAAYIPEQSYSGERLNVGSFKNPQDIFVADDGKVYVADTENHRIVVLDPSMKVLHEINKFDNHGMDDTFQNPSGLFVTEDQVLYIADTGNLRIVVMNPDGTLIKIIHNPTSEVLDDDFVFAPMKVAVDYAGRVYVVSKNMFQGIMAFDENSNFSGFTGTIQVNITLYEKIWRRLSTRAQRKRQIQFIPTEFTNLDISPEGFVYATNIDPKGEQSIRRLNPKGEDVIKKKKDGYLSGDIYWRSDTEYSGPSRIIDIVYRGNGIYSILDMKRGRIFTYDHEGNLLYIFGGKGSQEGTFKNPTAIEMKDGKIFALDAYRGEIMIFSATRYGELINNAVSLRYDGDEAAAVKLWEQVLKLDANFELAYAGIGKSYLVSGENKRAMDYFKLAMDRDYYSIAYKRYRDEILNNNLGYILTALVGFIVAFQINRIVQRRKEGSRGLE